MDDLTTWKPGTCLPAGPGGATQPVELPYWDDAEAALIIRRNMLTGGEPGSGKSVGLNLLALYAALSAQDGAPGGEHTGTEA